jgi:hypothetical protein
MVPTSERIVDPIPEIPLDTGWERIKSIIIRTVVKFGRGNVIFEDIKSLKKGVSR